MSRNEELTYLVGLLTEASKWRISEGDDRDPIRMEVEQRIDTLLGKTAVVVDGVEHSIAVPSGKPSIRNGGLSPEDEARRKLNHYYYSATHHTMWVDGKRTAVIRPPEEIPEWVSCHEPPDGFDVSVAQARSAEALRARQTTLPA